MITARRLRAREEPTSAPHPTSLPWEEHQRKIQELTKAHSIELSQLQNGPAQAREALTACSEELERVRGLAAERFDALEASSREVERLQLRVAALEEELAKAKAQASAPPEPPKVEPKPSAPAATPAPETDQKKR
jgi:chromosome segregation ATPase